MQDLERARRCELCANFFFSFLKNRKKINRNFRIYMRRRRTHTWTKNFSYFIYDDRHSPRTKQKITLRSHHQVKNRFLCNTHTQNGLGRASYKWCARAQANGAWRAPISFWNPFWKKIFFTRNFHTHTHTCSHHRIFQIINHTRTCVLPQ